MQSQTQNTEKSLVSDRLRAFQDALEHLYIKNNLSGRLKFAQEYPAPAAYIFGEELLHIDREGTRDRQKRSVLEEEAEDRRIALLEIAETLEERSADKGALITEYVRDIIMRHGRAASLFLYAPWLVDKFIAPPEGGDEPAEAQKISALREELSESDISIGPLPARMDVPLDIEEEKQPEQQARAPRIETPPLEDPMDSIKPISLEPVSPPAAVEVPRAPAPEHKPPVAPVSLTAKGPTIQPIAQQTHSADSGDQPFVPNVMERVEEPEEESSKSVPKKRGKLKIFGIKDSSSDNGAT